VEKACVLKSDVPESSLLRRSSRNQIRRREDAMAEKGGKVSQPKGNAVYFLGSLT
jgi:hypothetical protein